MPKLAKNLTDDIVERARVRHKKDGEPEAQRDLWDGKISGLGLRVSRTGKKVWYFRYRTKSGRQRRYKIGEYQPSPGLDLRKARRRARKLHVLVDDGVDPIEEERRQAQADKTFKDLAEFYLLEHALGPGVRRDEGFDVWTVRTIQGEPAKRSWAEDRRKLLVEARPWANIPARDITKHDVRDLIKRVVDRGSLVSANRLQACLHKTFAVGVEFEVVDANPVAGMRHLGGKERSRDRVLSAQELRDFWTVTEGMPLPWRAHFQLRLLTGQRCREVVDMRWSDLDESWRWWTVPATSSKNKLSHRVPLSEPVRNLLRKLREVQPAGEVFVTTGARGNRQRAIEARAFKLVNFRPHDLRHTVMSRITSEGVDRLVAGKLLNHKDRGVDAVYDRHSYDPEKEHAIGVWTETLLRILDPEPDEAITLNR